MQRIATVLGARPQFIKAAAVSRALINSGSFSEVLIHTGQHYDANMSKVFFDELEIPAPAYHLGIGSGTHGAQTGQMLQAIEKVLVETRPDCVLVYGDTNSTLAGALAAVKLHIPVAHVEAGLRSFNRRMPEEINRVLTDHAAEILFTPTENAVLNLKNEGINADFIHAVGDVMYDAALFYGALAEERSQVLNRNELRRKEYVLATIHRAENTDDPSRLQAIIEAFSQVAGKIPVVWPMHPRTRAAISRLGAQANLEKVLHVLEPVSYLEMVQLERNALSIATDSGGVQKEAFFYGVPCVTVRDETEWVELVEMGWNRLAPPVDSASLATAIQESFGRLGEDANPYGDGNSSQRIAGILKN